MTRVVVFDMDDTLYPEITHVHSGFQAVAEFAEARFGWPAAVSSQQLRRYLRANGRGAVFDRWLEDHDALTRSLVRECVKVYRHHRPAIRLYAMADRLLTRLEGSPLYVVTDGHKVTQSRKAEALDLPSRVRHVYLTNRYGRRHAKPSPHCFDLIRRRERARWDELVYVGDDPSKDFVALNERGGLTVRVRTGRHARREAPEGFEARVVLQDLRGLPATLRDHGHSRFTR